MEQYLASLHENLKDVSQFSSIHVVVGNESCDLDSAVCAVTYAYYLSQTNKEKTTLVIPVLNIPASQYHIHTEIVYVFQKNAIKSDHLVFLDQIEFGSLAASGQLKLTLVDHNVPTGQLSSLDEAVVSVIDHHVSERPENDKVTVKLDVVGSCSTLVAEELLNDPDFKIDQTVAELLLGTILIDTVNRLPEAGKITPRDTAVLERLQNVVPGVNGDHLYAEIQAAKLDMSSLSNMEILEKDLKMVSGTDMTIAMSSVPMDIQELLEKPSFQADLEKFCSNKMADVAIVMTMTTDVEGQPARQMAVFSTNRIYRDQIADVLDNSDDLDLDLEPVTSTLENISVFHQGNTAASRKLIMPVLGSFLHGDRSPDVPNKDFVSDSSETEGFTSFSNILDQDIPDGPESFETSLESSANKTVTSQAFLNSETDSFCPSFGLQVIEEDSNEQFSNSDVKKEHQTLPSGEKSSANSSNLFDFLTSGSSELMDPFSSVEENPSVVETSPIGGLDEHLDGAESSSSAITTDTNSTDPFNVLSSDSNENINGFNTNQHELTGDLNEFGQLEATQSDKTIDISNSADINDDPFGLFNNTVEPTNSNNNPFAVEHFNSNPFETNDNFMKAFSSDQDPFGANNEMATNQDPFGFNENFASLQSSDKEHEAASGDLSASNPFGDQFKSILTPYNSTEDTNESSNPSTNPFQLNVSVVEPVNVFPDPFGSLPTGYSPILELPEDQSENEHLSTGREGGARAKARKSISLIVEVDKESDSEALVDFDESDFYDRVPSPERDRSGSDSPYINPNFTSPFGRYRTRTSDSSSGFPSVTTPPNSVIETSLDAASQDHDLPSFNSAEMVERIRRKKQSLHGHEDLLGSDIGLMSTPYTPQNSFRDDFERKSHGLDLLNLDDESMSAKIKEKRDSLGVFSPVDIPQTNTQTNTSALLDFGDIPEESSELTVASFPNVPSNSFVGTPGDFMHKHALEGLQDKLAQLHDTQDNAAAVDEDELVMLDFSTKHSNNKDHTGSEIQGQTGSQTLFDMDFMKTESEEQLQSENTSNTNNVFLPLGENKSKESDTNNELLSFMENKSLESNKNDALLSFEENKSLVLADLEKSVHDVAVESVSTAVTHEIIDEAVEKFPDMDNPDLAECVTVEMLMGDNSNWSEQASGDSGIASNDSSQPVPPRSPRSPRRVFNNDNKFNVETEYLPNMDPLHGNLNIVTSPSSPSQTIETDADKEVVESESFRRVSGQEHESLSVLDGVTSLDDDMSEQGRELLPGPQHYSETAPEEKKTDIQNMIMEENLLTSRPSTGYLQDQKNDEAEGASYVTPPVDLFDQDIEKDSESMVDSSPEHSEGIDTLADNTIDLTNKVSVDSPNTDIPTNSEGIETLAENIIDTTNESSVNSASSDKQMNASKPSQDDETENKAVDFKTDIVQNLDIENGNIAERELVAEKVMSSMNEFQDDLVAIETVSPGDTTGNEYLAGFHEVNPEFREAAEACISAKYNTSEETVFATDNETESISKLPTVQESLEGKKTIDDKDSSEKQTVSSSDTLSTGGEPPVLNASDNETTSVVPELDNETAPFVNESESEFTQMVSKPDTETTQVMSNVNNETAQLVTQSDSTNEPDNRTATVVTGIDNVTTMAPQTIEITDVDGTTATVVPDIGETNSISPDSSSSFISTSDSESELITVRENLVTESASSVLSADKEIVKNEDVDSIKQDNVESNMNSISKNSNVYDDVIYDSLVQSDKIQESHASSYSSTFKESEEFDQNTYTSYDISNVDDIVTTFGENWGQSNLSSIQEEDDTFFGKSTTVTNDFIDTPKESTHDSIDVSMTESAVTIETISPVETPNDEHATGFYEVNPESRDPFDMSVSDMNESQFDTNLGENVTGFYEINPEGNAVMAQSTETTESVSPAVTPNDEHASGFYNIAAENDTNIDGEGVSLTKYSEMNIEEKETGDMKYTMDVSGDEIKAPEINVDDFDYESDESRDSSDDGETGFYDMNAKIQGTMLQNIEIGNSYSPMESPNDEVIDINPMVHDHNNEQSNAFDNNTVADISTGNTEDDPATDHEEQLVQLADAMVTEAITGALDTVQEMHIEKHESFIVSEIANAMVDENTDIDNSATGFDVFKLDTNSGNNDGNDRLINVLDVVSQGASSLNDVNDDSSDSDTSSTTTEGSYRIPHSQDDSPIMSPENESFMKKENGIMSPLIEPVIKTKTNTQYSSNGDGFVHDITEGSQSSEVFEEVVDDNGDSIRLKDKDTAVLDADKCSQDTVFTDKVINLEQSENTGEKKKESILKDNVSEIDVSNENAIDSLIEAQTVKSVETVFDFDQAADLNVNKDNFKAESSESFNDSYVEKDLEIEVISETKFAQVSELKQESSSNGENINKDKITKSLEDEKAVDEVKHHLIIEEVKKDVGNKESDKQIEGDANEIETNKKANFENQFDETLPQIKSNNDDDKETNREENFDTQSIETETQISGNGVNEKTQISEIENVDTQFQEIDDQTSNKTIINPTENVDTKFEEFKEQPSNENDAVENPGKKSDDSSECSTENFDTKSEDIEKQTSNEKVADTVENAEKRSGDSSEYSTKNTDTKSEDIKKQTSNETDADSVGDTGTKSDGSSEYVTRREIFYTSAGRMSISIDSVVDKQVSDEQEMQVQDIIHEAVEIPAIGPILARAESVVGHVDDMLSEETIAHLQHLHNMHKSSCTDFDIMSLTSQPPDDDDEDDEDDKDVKPEEEVKPPKPQPTVKPSPQSSSHGKMKSMEDTQEWHEDPIPGMAAQEDESESESDSDTDSEYTKPVRPDSLPSTKRKKKITANSNMVRNDSTDDLVEGVDDLPTPDDLETPDDMEGEELEWEDDTPITPIESKKFTEYRQVVEDDEEDKDQEENGQYRKVEIAGKDYRVDMHVIEPYKKVLSHGGYYGDGLNAIILFCGCYLPDRSRRDYQYVMDNLFLYVISTLELLVAEDYMIVYFHGATPRRQMPSFGWLKRCYQMIDRRLRKNLKALLMVHPTLWLKTVVMMTKPFISSKFSSKLRFVKTLQELGKIVPMEYIYVPDPVTQYDTRLKQHRTSSSSSTPISPTSPS